MTQSAEQVLARFGIHPTQEELAAIEAGFEHTRAATSVLDTVDTSGIAPTFGIADRGASEPGR